MTYAPALNCIKYSVGIDETCGSGGLIAWANLTLDVFVIRWSGQITIVLTT